MVAPSDAILVYSTSVPNVSKCPSFCDDPPKNKTFNVPCLFRPSLTVEPEQSESNLSCSRIVPSIYEVEYRRCRRTVEVVESALVDYGGFATWPTLPTIGLKPCPAKRLNTRSSIICDWSPCLGSLPVVAGVAFRLLQFSFFGFRAA